MKYMCSINFIMQQTGLTEDQLLAGNRQRKNLIVKSFCYKCLKKSGMSYSAIARKFGYNSHAAITHQIEVLYNNRETKMYQEAKSRHECFKEEVMPEEKIIIHTDAPIEIVVKDIEETILEKIMRTPVLSPTFEDLIREMNILSVRYSHQR